MTGADGRFGARTVLARMASLLRDHWAALLPAALVIFIPVGLLDTLDADLQDAVGETNDLASGLEVLAVTMLNAASALLGQILFAGLISALATHGTGPGIGGLVDLGRELPIGRLILADIAFVLVITAGLFALIVPGFVFLVWFALIGPVVEVEHIGIRRAFGRSRELVRRRFRLVAAFVLPITILEGSIGGLIARATSWSFGDDFLGHWVTSSANALLTSTLLALAATVLYLELTADEASPRTPPAESRQPRRGTPA